MQLALTIAKTQKQGDRLAAMTAVIDLIPLEDLLGAAAEGVDLQTVRLDSRRLSIRSQSPPPSATPGLDSPACLSDSARGTLSRSNASRPRLGRAAEGIRKRVDMRVRLAYWEYNSGYSLQRNQYVDST